MAHPKVASIIHYGARIDYAVTSAELQQLENGSGTAWRDSCLMAASVFVTTASNAVGALAGQTAFQPSLALFVNALIAGIALFASLASAVGWRKTALAHRHLFEEIRDRPGFILNGDSLEMETVSAPLVDHQGSAGHS